MQKSSKQDPVDFEPLVDRGGYPKAILKGSVKERHMYRFRCDFSSCLESTEIRHADSSYVKICPHTCFQKRRNKASNNESRNPTLFGNGQRERERWGGVDFPAILSMDMIWTSVLSA